MKTLDLYIARLYLTNILVILVALMSFVVAVDVVLNISTFMSAGRKIAGEDASTIQVSIQAAYAIVDLWGPRLLQLFSYLAGVVLIAAMGFTCVNLVRRRELIAVLASGISLHRVFVPFILVALVVTAAQAINQEVLIPKVAHKLFRDHKGAGQDTIANLRVPLIPDSAGRLWYAVNYDNNEERMDSITVWERDTQGVVLSRITADTAQWTGDNWALTNGLTEAPNGQRTPINTIETDLDPTGVLIKRIEGFGQNLSWSQITTALNQPVPISDRTRRELNTIRFGRFAVMAGNLLVLCLSLPFFLMREPRGMLQQTLKCAPIGGLALIGTILAVSAPPPGLPIWIGVAIPTLILIPIAIATASSLRT